MSDNISRYPTADVMELPEDLRDKILAVQEKAGFVPNVFLALGHRPLELRAFMDYHDALMEKESGKVGITLEFITDLQSVDNR